MKRVAMIVALVVAICVMVVSGLWLHEFLMIDSCLDAGGAWDNETAECDGVDGLGEGERTVLGWVLLLGILAGIAAAPALMVYFLLLLVHWRKEAKSLE